MNFKDLLLFLIEFYMKTVSFAQNKYYLKIC